MISTYIQTAFLSLLTLSLSLPVYAELLTDPTRPPYYQPPTTSTYSQPDTTQAWVLHSTLVSPQQRLAVINGKTLTVGEEINGATVTAIDHQSVELTIGDKKTILNLQKSFIGHMN